MSRCKVNNERVVVMMECMQTCLHTDMLAHVYFQKANEH
jgi:hypothetical protein